MAWISLAGVSICVLILIALHFLEPGIDPVERTLSEYVLGRRSWLFSIAMIAWGMSAFALAAAFIGSSSALGPVLLCIFGAAMIVAGIFPADAMDPRAREFELSRSGTIHALAGFVACISICTAGPVLTRGLTAWIPAIGFVIFLLTVVLRGALQALTGRVSLHGIGERIGFASFIGWMILSASVFL